MGVDTVHRSLSYELPVFIMPTSISVCRIPNIHAFEQSVNQSSKQSPDFTNISRVGDYQAKGGMCNKGEWEFSVIKGC